MDVHKGEGGPVHVDACGQRGGRVSKTRFFCGRHKWMTPKGLGDQNGEYIIGCEGTVLRHAYECLGKEK